jgi:predicted DNA binding CopG/RHH family protein
MAKRLKMYDHIEFDEKEVLAGMARLRGARRKATSIALEKEMIAELKEAAAEKGLPYQVFMRLLLGDGLKKPKVS